MSFSTKLTVTKIRFHLITVNFIQITTGFCVIMFVISYRVSSCIKCEHIFNIRSIPDENIYYYIIINNEPEVNTISKQSGRSKILIL